MNKKFFNLIFLCHVFLLMKNPQKYILIFSRAQNPHILALANPHARKPH